MRAEAASLEVAEAIKYKRLNQLFILIKSGLSTQLWLGFGSLAGGAFHETRLVAKMIWFRLADWNLGNLFGMIGKQFLLLLFLAYLFYLEQSNIME